MVPYNEALIIEKFQVEVIIVFRAGKRGAESKYVICYRIIIIDLEVRYFMKLSRRTLIRVVNQWALYVTRTFVLLYSRTIILKWDRSIHTITLVQPSLSNVSIGKAHSNVYIAHCGERTSASTEFCINDALNVKKNRIFV